MPERDVVSWNQMISGYAGCGLCDEALRLFAEMRNFGVRPSEYTYSALMGVVYCGKVGKVVHGSMVRSGVDLSNVVVGNSLINMYGKVGLVGYSFHVFAAMNELDTISWNSLISAFRMGGHGELGLRMFSLMRSMGYSHDAYTLSAIMSVCSDLCSLDKGKKIFALSIKEGFLFNTIFSSAAIHLFSKCNRLEDSVRLFVELDLFDSALCNSMISSYTLHGLGEDVVRLFKLMLRKYIRPTEVTLSCVLNSISDSPGEQGTQVHSIVVKLGFESETIVACSLVEMYSNLGLVDPAITIFSEISSKDLISWNTIITCLTRNGKVVETLDIFVKLLEFGPQPDKITLAGVLLACNYGNFVDFGMEIFSSMEKEHGIVPSDEHYTCVIDMLCRAGKLKEAINIISTMPCPPNFSMWKSVLFCSSIQSDLVLIEKVAEMMIEMKISSPLPYVVLARVYEMTGNWEGMVRVMRGMKGRGDEKPIECSNIVVKNHVYSFGVDQLLQRGDQDIGVVLELLMLQIDDRVPCCLE
ncbi:hypothetical protein ACFE04_015721 [Oxalis oulophora]